MNPSKKVSTLEGLTFGDERRSGRTTRIVDHAVQLLLQGFVIEVKDHNENGQNERNNIDLAKRIFGRIKTEHPDLSSSLKISDSKLEMYIHGIGTARSTPIFNTADLRALEDEIQARIEFKMNEFLTAIKNRLAFKHAQCPLSTEDYAAYKALEEISEIMAKEVRLPTPHEDMAGERKRKAKDLAVKKITDGIDLRGRYYSSVVRVIVSAIENALDCCFK